MLRKLLIICVTSLLSICCYVTASYAAVGCTLSNPAQDLKYLFPEMTSYREELRSFESMPDGRDLFNKLTERVGGEMDAIYESYETPYTIYLVFKGSERIGIVHGVNVPGEGGVIQVFLSVDPNSGAIRKMFYQRLESGISKLLKAQTFREQFIGLTLIDWYKNDYYAEHPSSGVTDRIAKLVIPGAADTSSKDGISSVRAVRKNLVLLDQFLFEGRSEPYFLRAQLALKGETDNGKKVK